MAPFVIYISDSVKEGLRKHAGEMVQIDASEVHQSINPGDALVSKFTYVGPAPKSTSEVEQGIAQTLKVETSLGGKDDKCDGEGAVSTVLGISSGEEWMKLS